MREIKFRAWHNDQMSKPFTLGEAVCWPDGKVSTANRVGIVMQFTGLLDRNGVEIYEGDVLANDSGRTAKVVWAKFGGLWDAEPVCTAGTPDGFSCNLWGRWVSVIGNIHQNPELLEGKV